MTSPRETTWWTSACPPPRMARGGANCSAVRTCNPWQPPPPASAPPSHLGQLVIEIHSVGLLLSARAAISSQSALVFRRESALSCFKQSQRDALESISNYNLTQVQSATPQCKNRTGDTQLIATSYP